MIEKRQRRRGDLARMKAKAERLALEILRFDENTYATLYNHLANCSCRGCGNPRRHEKGVEKLTMPERRAMEASRDGE